MEEKDKISKSFKIYLIILLLLMLIFINPSIRSNILDIFRSFNKSEKELQLSNEFIIDKDIKKIDIYKGKIIQYKHNKLSFLDFNGFEVLKKDFEFKNPYLFIGENSLYMIDRSSGDIYILNKEGDTLERISYKMPIYRLDEKDQMLIVHRKNDDEENIDILDEKGKLILNHMEKIPILTMDIKDNKKTYSISTLDLEKGLDSILNTYSSDGKKLASKKIEDEIIVLNKFIKNDTLIATDKGLYLLNKDEVKWEKKYDGLKDIKVTDSEILLLYNNKFETLNLRGNLKKEIVLSSPVEKILEAGDDILLYGDRNIIIPGKNKNILNFKSKEDIVNLKYDNGDLLLQKEGKIEIYKINKKVEK